MNWLNITEISRKWLAINYILEIDFDSTCPKALSRLRFLIFGISKYNQYSQFRTTLQGNWTRIIETISIWPDGCKIWKIYTQSCRIIAFKLRNIKEQDSLSLPVSVSCPSLMDCNDGRSTSINSFTFYQYFQLLSISNNGMPNHLM